MSLSQIQETLIDLHDEMIDADPTERPAIQSIIDDANAELKFRQQQFRNAENN